MKLFSKIVACLLLSGSAFADMYPLPPSGPIMSPAPTMGSGFVRSRYLCKSPDGQAMVRVFPDDLRATVIKLNGLPSYDMICSQGAPESRVWITCEGADSRTFNLFKGGMEGEYVGSVKNTRFFCYDAGGHFR